MSASKTNGSTTPAWLIAIRPSRSTRTVSGISLKWHGSTKGRRSITAQVTPSIENARDFNPSDPRMIDISPKGMTGKTSRAMPTDPLRRLPRLPISGDSLTGVSWECVLPLGNAQLGRSFCGPQRKRNFQFPNWKFKPTMSSCRVRTLRFFSNSPSRTSRLFSRKVWLRACRFLRPRYRRP